jgi:hypothetical protein
LICIASPIRYSLFKVQSAERVAQKQDPRIKKQE